MRSIPRDLIETALRVNNATDEVVIFILCDKMLKYLQLLLSGIKLQKMKNNFCKLNVSFSAFIY